MSLNIVFAASEAAPFSKTGGLADVAGALPSALEKLDCRVCVFLPFHRVTALGGFDVSETGVQVSVPIGSKQVRGRVFKAVSSGPDVYLIKCDEYFDRTFLYGTPELDYSDNLERFAFFSRAVLEAIRALAIRPDIIHSNDWQTGLVGAYLNDFYRSDPLFAKAANLFTVHNLAYQGLFSPGLYGLTGLSQSFFSPEGLEFWGRVSLLKAGIVSADIISTVSETYAKEIQMPEQGCGLDGLLRHNSQALFGIINGVDYNEWSPEADAFIPQKYSPVNMKGKAVCRAELIKEFGLKLKAGAPLIGMVTRLTEQKGMAILASAMPELMKLDIGFVLLGTGDKKYVDMAERFASDYKPKLGVKIAFENKLAHLVEAGADMFLMPSRYEPCGLNQIYSLKYGTVPVVRATGGLEDTVKDAGAGAVGNTGFKFKDYSGEALVNAVKRAAALFKDKNAWKELQLNGMKEDFSWEKSAIRYLELYRKAAKK
ncbi:glycogen synthase GlgA [bacterium]|nr:MAG: glycogen synthase GlgA [bacterium]